MIRIFAAILIAALTCCVAGAQTTKVYVSPSGSGTQCTEAQPCGIDSAVSACPGGGLCNIYLADGTYPDPAVNLYYYRAFTLFGNCKNPSAVLLRGTRTNKAIIWVQDHATATITCMSLEATTPGASGIQGRQHAIIDFASLNFGEFSGGTFVSVTDSSVGSCTGPISINGSTSVPFGATSLSKLSLPCAISIPTPISFSHFVNVTSMSILDASAATFTGDGTGSASSGTTCNSSQSIVTPPAVGFPGNRPGNC